MGKQPGTRDERNPCGRKMTRSLYYSAQSNPHSNIQISTALNHRPTHILYHSNTLSSRDIGAMRSPHTDLVRTADSSMEFTHHPNIPYLTQTCEVLGERSVFPFPPPAFFEDFFLPDFPEFGDGDRLRLRELPGGYVGHSLRK